MDFSEDSQPRALHHISISQPPPLPLAEIPRGSVSARVNFFEGLSAGPSPRAVASDQVFQLNPLNQVLELDPPESVEIDKVPEDESSHETPALSVLTDPGFTKSRGSYKAAGGDQAAGMKSAQTDGEVDAVCINCQEYVSVQDMDDHSLMCAHVEIQPNTLQEETALKVRKLHRGINRRIKVSHGERLHLMQRMREIIVQITKNEHAPLASFNQELQELALEALSVKGGIPCAIFARRLACLVGEKELLLESANAEAIFETEQQELIQWQPRAVVSAAINDIRSDMGKNSDASSSRVSIAKSDDVADIEAAEDEAKYASEEQLKKYFYSICLKQKLLLPKHHPRQKALVSSLYEEAMRQCISPGQWETFISQSLAREED